MPALDDDEGLDASCAPGSGESFDAELAAGSAADDASETTGMPELDAPGEYGSFFTERSLGGA